MMKKVNKWNVFLAVTFILVGMMAISLIGCKEVSAAKKVTINIIYMKGHPVFEANLAGISEFEKQNPNIKVNLVDVPYGSILSKEIEVLSAHSSEFDIIFINDDWMPLLGEGASLQPLQDIPELQDELADIPKEFIETVTYPHPKYHLPDSKIEKLALKDPQIYGLPFQIGATVLFYRKDLIEQPPRTKEEFVEIAKKLSDPEKGIYGFTTMLKARELGIAFLPFMYIREAGGNLFDENWNPTIDSPATREMLQFVYDCLHKYKIFPPGMISYGRTEARNLFMNGQSMMLIDDSSVWGQIKDPEQSKVADVAGMALIPRWSTKSHEYYCGGTWNWGINKYTKHLSEAVKVLEFLCSSEANVELYYKTGTGAPRISAKEQLLREAGPEYKIINYVTEHLGYLRTEDKMINVPEWPELSVKIEEQFVRYWMDQCSLEEAVKGAQNVAYDILEKAGYYK